MQRDRIIDVDSSGETSVQLDPVNRWSERHGDIMTVECTDPTTDATTHGCSLP
jgi:hypothetical protein